MPNNNAFNPSVLLHVYNNETTYFPTQRLDTLTWAIEGGSMGLKVTAIGTNAAGKYGVAQLSPWVLGRRTD